MAESNFINVKIQVGKTTQNMQMEKGCVFQNKGGSYCVFDDGTLKFQKAGTSEWQNASHISMTNYQWKAFQNVADNDGKSATYSKQDILNAQQKFKQGGFTADMSKDLPTGYKIEHPKMSTADKSVEVGVTNGNETQSAKLKFQIAEMQVMKDASSAKLSKTSYKGKLGNTVHVTTNGNTTTKTTNGFYSTDKYTAVYKNGVITSLKFGFETEGNPNYGEYKFDGKGRIVSTYFYLTPDEKSSNENMYMGVNYKDDGSCRVTDYVNKRLYEFDSHGRMLECYDGNTTYKYEYLKDGVCMKHEFTRRADGSTFEATSVGYPHSLLDVLDNIRALSFFDAK